MEVLEKKKEKIILEKNFERQRLKKYAQYVTDKTSSRRRVSIMSFYRTDPGNKNNTFCLFCVLCFLFFLFSVMTHNFSSSPLLSPLPPLLSFHPPHDW